MRFQRNMIYMTINSEKRSILSNYGYIRIKPIAYNLCYVVSVTKYRFKNLKKSWLFTALFRNNIQKLYEKLFKWGFQSMYLWNFSFYGLDCSSLQPYLTCKLSFFWHKFFDNYKQIHYFSLKFKRNYIKIIYIKNVIAFS